MRRDEDVVDDVDDSVGGRDGVDDFRGAGVEEDGMVVGDGDFYGGGMGGGDGVGVRRGSFGIEDGTGDNMI